MAKVFGVYDQKVNAFMQPFTMESEGQALRAFSDHVNNPESIWCRHPKDFTLYCLGTFDESSGEFVNERSFVVEASTVKIENGVDVHPDLEGQQLDVEDAIRASE